MPSRRRALDRSSPQRRPRFFAGRFRLERELRLAAPRAEAFFLAGRRAADFFAGFLAVFFADFLAVFFADFLTAFFAVFAADFFAAFFPDFFAAFRGAAARERDAVAPVRGAEDPLSRLIPEAERSGAGAGAENAGAGGTGGGRGSDMGLSSIHPPLVQPVSISSDPDIGAPCSQRGATRRRFRPPGPW